jgi:hypothetical protein
MIRPEFRKVLLDQRGAAVILWSFFVISIPVYIVISQKFVTAPAAGGSSFTDTIRIVVWLLTLVDLGSTSIEKAKSVFECDFNEREEREAVSGWRFRGTPRARHCRVAYITRKVVVFAIIEAIAVCIRPGRRRLRRRSIFALWIELGAVSHRVSVGKIPRRRC